MMKITAQKTNRKDHFNLYTALKVLNYRCLQFTMRVKANNREEALSEENKKKFIQKMIKPYLNERTHL